MLRATLMASSLVSVLLAGSAQAQSAAQYSGKYDLTCKSISVGYTLDIAGAIAGGEAGHVPQAYTLPLFCDQDDPALVAALDAIAAGVEAACESLTNGTHPDCAGAGQSFRAALAGVNAGLVDQLPVYANLYVYNADNWFNQLINLYPLGGSTLNGAGDVTEVGATINGQGQFGAVGLQVFGGDGFGDDQAGLGCVAWATASVDGRAKQGSPGRLSAKYAINGNLTCGAAATNTAWLLVNIGLNVQAEVQGPKR